MSDFWEGYVPEPAQQKPVTRVNLDMTGAMATLPKTGSESVVEYKPVISDVGADANIAGLPGTYYGIVPKGAGKITLHESKPAQRTWVGLTDEERVDLWRATETDNQMVLIEAIEAKLKEKNT